MKHYRKNRRTNKMKPLDELFSGLLKLRGKHEIYSDEWKEIDQLIKLYFQHQEETIKKLKELAP